MRSRVEVGHAGNRARRPVLHRKQLVQVDFSAADRETNSLKYASRVTLSHRTPGKADTGVRHLKVGRQRPRGAWKECRVQAFVRHRFTGERYNRSFTLKSPVNRVSGSYRDAICSPNAPCEPISCRSRQSCRKQSGPSAFCFAPGKYGAGLTPRLVCDPNSQFFGSGRSDRLHHPFRERGVSPREQ